MEGKGCLTSIGIFLILAGFAAMSEKDNSGGIALFLGIVTLISVFVCNAIYNANADCKFNELIRKEHISADLIDKILKIGNSTLALRVLQIILFIRDVSGIKPDNIPSGILPIIASEFAGSTEGDRLFRLFFRKIWEHYAALITKERQTVMQDDYGNYIYSYWTKEIKYFLINVCNCSVEKSILFPDLDKITINNYVRIFNRVYSITKQLNPAYQPKSIKVESGAEYEDAVKILLENAGYEVRKTPVTGDQGVDLIVTHDDKKCAIQCKFYSGSVGNKAVQEVIAGRDFYDCDFGIVCSNSTYTKSARQLAHSQNISLTSHNEIAEVIGKLVC